MSEGICLRKKMNGDIQAAEAFLNELPRFTKKNSLAHTRKLMALLGDPCADRTILHVAGSNGKGSVCNFLYHMLLAGGESAAMFVSPHLTDMRERFQINGQPVSEEAFLAAYERVTAAARELAVKGEPHPTFFEFLYAMAMVLFEEAGVSYVILETGLGGRLDATNSFPTPALSVITPIALEHTEILGDSIAQIAAEKAGILKPGVPVVYAAGSVCGATGDARDAAADEAAEVIAARAARLGCPAAAVVEGEALAPDGEEDPLSLQTRTVFYRIENVGEKEMVFSLTSAYDKKTTWHLPGRAFYQAQNAALAITALRVLRDAGRWPEDADRRPEDADRRPEDAGRKIPALTDETLQRGLAEADWPGRMQEALPDIFLDGAHNPAGIAAFLSCAREIARDDAEAPLLLVSMMREKDLAAAAELFVNGLHWEAVAVTTVSDARGADPTELAAVFANAAQDASAQVGPAPWTPEVFPDARAAFSAMRERKKPGQKLFCTGSLYFLGELMRLL